MSVKVAVRVRPFNNRQITLGCSLCVQMQGNTTKLLDFGQEKKTRQFAFDYSFWSHDQFQIQTDGYSKPTGSKYADQKMVYQSVGKQILDNAWQGYHCCLFAYGQTGSGKSYSMIGYGANSGIVPISCQQIFQRISKNKDQKKEFDVQVSMMEIYNEKVQDLLIPVHKRPKEGLKIRQHKNQGVYVQGLSKHYVNTYELIKAKMEQGNTHRSVAATQMNASSSRAHTIISIQFRQKQTLIDKKVEKVSVIYLVDLAGSERVEKTGAEGTRLKQAAGINKSLSVLGLVISNLADKAMGKGKNTVIPYRDSCLTRILQNALGGNSKTLMICAISPATDNYQQTLSTLRYADQAKKIQNKAIINQNQTDKMIRQLTQENDRLKKIMDQLNKMGIDVMDEATLQRFYETKSHLTFNNQMIKEYTIVQQQKSNQSLIKQQQFDQNQPHIVNLNQDPLLSKKVKYSMSQKNITIGRKQAQPSNDIIIGGVGVSTHHAIIFKCEDQFYFKPLREQQNSNCFINGKPVVQKVQLYDQDRLICGTNSTFLIVINGNHRQKIIQQQIDWQFAQEQLFQNRKVEQSSDNENKNKKVKQKIRQSIMKKQLQFEKLQLQKLNDIKLSQIKNQNYVQEQKYKQQFQKLKNEIESQKQQLNQITQQDKKKATEKVYFEKKLARFIPKLNQINEIAKQFGRDIRLSANLMLMTEEQRHQNKINTNKILKIKVTNREVGYNYYWSIQTFHQRYYAIKDLWEAFLENDEVQQLKNEDDPFWDPLENTHICFGYITMMNLPYLLDNESTLSLVDQNGQCGKLSVALTPTDETGNINLTLQDHNNEDSEIFNKPFYFTIQIKQGRIPQNYSQVFIEYSLKLDQNQRQIFKSQKVTPTYTKVNFNYKYVHKIYNMTENMFQYLKNSNLCLDIYGITKVRPVEQNIQNQNKQNNNTAADKFIQKIMNQRSKYKPLLKKFDACSLI